ncbi:MAG: ankyrin repeat domain-containing protein [Candidatus Dependentiae bacterium]|nr:ankyrin repeat domain-containing protein [Candidatus Dependentiae bacterium]
MFTLIVTKNYILFLCTLFGCNLYSAAIPTKTVSIEQQKNDLFILSCKYGYLEPLKILYRNGVSVNIKNDKGNYPIHIAAQQNNIEILEFLLQQDASMHVQDKCKDTAFHWAAFKGHTEALTTLLLYEKRKAELPPECNRIIPLGNILTCLPHSIIPTIIEYTGLENAKGESLPVLMLPSLTLKNQWKRKARESALCQLNKNPNIAEKKNLTLCIDLFESHYSQVMHFLISKKLAQN